MTIDGTPVAGLHHIALFPQILIDVGLVGQVEKIAVGQGVQIVEGHVVGDLPVAYPVAVARNGDVAARLAGQLGIFIEPQTLEQRGLVGAVQHRRVHIQPGDLQGKGAALIAFPRLGDKKLILRQTAVVRGQGRSRRRRGRRGGTGRGAGPDGILGGRQHRGLAVVPEHYTGHDQRRGRSHKGRNGQYSSFHGVVLLFRSDPFPGSGKPVSRNCAGTGG